MEYLDSFASFHSVDDHSVCISTKCLKAPKTEQQRTKVQHSIHRCRQVQRVEPPISTRTDQTTTDQNNSCPMQSLDQYQIALSAGLRFMSDESASHNLEDPPEAEQENDLDIVEHSLWVDLDLDLDGVDDISRLLLENESSADSTMTATKSHTNHFLSIEPESILEILPMPKGKNSINNPNITEQSDHPSLPTEVVINPMDGQGSITDQKESYVYGTGYSKEKKYQCQICDKIFKKSGYLKIHTLIHTGEKPYACKSCDKRFAQAYLLKSHTRTHTGERPYPCKICDKRFTQAHLLRNHIRTHTGEKPYPCKICDKRFALPGNRKQHMQTHFDEKPYSCEICKKGFTQRSNLKKHMCTHTGEKPYPCMICNKRFSLFHILQMHLRVHSGEKPYPCRICNKSFAQSGELKKHLSIHIGEKPYQCKTCNKSFARSGYLKKHLRNHTDQKSDPQR